MEPPKHTDVLKIRISGLSNGIREYHFSADPLEVELGNNFVHPVEVNAVLDKTTGQIFLKVSLQTAGRFQCDRCLEEFTQNISASYNVFFVYEEGAAGKCEPEEIQVISPDTVAIDLTEDVRQAVLLSVPLKLLCKENCQGLCPKCGINRNERTCNCKDQQTDPRFEGLQKLLKTE